MKTRGFFFFLISFSAPCILFAGNLNSFDFTFNDLKIYGHSNINNFSFVLENTSDSLSDGKVITERNKYQTSFLMPVNRFKTQNKYIQEDFFKMIKADEFPFINLSFENEQMKLLASSENCDSLNAFITIAGNSKKYCIHVNKELNHNKKIVSGKIKLNLSDFNLIPISKFLGLVKVNNVVIADFRINFIT